jgi:hypothetical protein
MYFSALIKGTPSRKKASKENFTSGFRLLDKTAITTLRHSFEPVSSDQSSALVGASLSFELMTQSPLEVPAAP